MRPKCSAISGSVAATAAVVITPVSSNAACAPRPHVRSLTSSPVAASKRRCAGPAIAASDAVAAKDSWNDRSSIVRGSIATISAAASAIAGSAAPRRPAAPASSSSVPMIAARTTGASAPTNTVYTPITPIASQIARRRPSSQALPATTSAASRLTLAPEITTRCDNPVALRSSRRSGCSAPRRPVTMPCASPVSGSSSAIARPSSSSARASDSAARIGLPASRSRIVTSRAKPVAAIPRSAK